MLDGNEGARTVQETYACAVSSGSTKTVPHRTGPGDIVASAGMSQYRMGTALMRLMSEWQGGATPPNRAKVPDPKTIARQLAVQRVERGIIASEEEYGGMRVSDKRDRRALAPVTKQEMELAAADARLLAARTTNWQLHEHKMRFQRMKTLPAVRAALRFWVLEKWGDLGAAGAEQIVADTLRHFLAPVCPVCEGRKRKVIQSRAIGAECKPCRGTGEVDLQHGARGRALMGYMKQCLGQAASDMREGAHRLRRSDKSEQDRAEHRSNETATNLRRADAEAKADEMLDTASVVEKFKASMSRTRSA